MLSIIKVAIVQLLLLPLLLQFNVLNANELFDAIEATRRIG